MYIGFDKQTLDAKNHWMKGKPEKVILPSGVQSMPLHEHVRKRPGMYFRGKGAESIPYIIFALLEGVLKSGSHNYSGPIELSVTERKKGQFIEILFRNLNHPAFLPANPDQWMAAAQKRAWELEVVPATTDLCLQESSDGRKIGSIRWDQGVPGAGKVVKKKGKSFLRYLFQLNPVVFQTASVEQLYKISGILRDVSLLRAGLATVFGADALEQGSQFYYEEGLKSLLFEADYQRHSLHPGCLSFKAKQGEMTVECHLRFLHAGTAHVLNYANFTPTQGGAHLEGLGKAINELFGKDARGCRDVLFVTNPDDGSNILLPYSCIGALHLQTPEPRYQGPTKDVLMGDDVRDFVYESAKKHLAGQWNAFKSC